MVQAGRERSVFRYLDSASSRAGAIVGLGGTGSFILDLIAKTPIHEIHPYDADKLYTHNAFRGAPAASVEELDAAPAKVDHYQHTFFACLRGRQQGQT